MGNRGSSTYAGVRDFFFEIGRGAVAKHSSIIIRGHNTDIDTGAEEDLWEAGGTIAYLTSAETMDIVSTSTNDASPSGTGGRTVLVSGVDGDYNAITETVALNGTTDVETTATFLRVNSIVLLTAGSTSTHAGNITATASSAATVQCEADAGEGISQNSQYTVALNTTFYLVHLELNAAKISGASPEIEFRGLARQLNLSADAPFLQLFDKKMDTAVQDELDVMLPFPFKAPQKTDIKMVATTDSNNTEARTRMYGIIVED